MKLKGWNEFTDSELIKTYNDWQDTIGMVQTEYYANGDLDAEEEWNDYLLLIREMERRHLFD